MTRQPLGVILAKLGKNVKQLSNEANLAYDTVAKVKRGIPDGVTIGTLRQIASAIDGVELVVYFSEESGE